MRCGHLLSVTSLLKIGKRSERMFQSRNGRVIEEGQRVRVYRNLHNGLFSIKDKKSGLVLGYTNNALLSDVTFIISKKGQERARKENTRNVHAYAEGFYMGEMSVNRDCLRPITYNPFDHDTFVYRDSNRPVDKVERLLCNQSRIYRMI